METATENRVGYQKTKLGWIPDDWDYSELEGKIELLSGYAFSSSDYSNEGIRLLRCANIKRGNTDWGADITKYWVNSANVEKYLMKEGDLVIAMDGSLVGRSYAMISKEDLPALLLQRVARLRSVKLHIPYLKEIIGSRYFVNYCDAVKTVTAIPHISAKDIKKFKVPLPPLPEQQKIATILSTWDKAIVKLSSLISEKEALKKGLMQQLLTGKKRFPGFTDEWKEVELGDVTKIYDGTHSTPKYVSTGVPFYSVEHVSRNDFSQTKYITEEVFEKENKRVKLEKGDVLMTRIGDVGTARLIDWDVRASFYVSLALIKKTKLFVPKFLEQAINSVAFQKELYKRMIHVAFPLKINLGEIGKCVIQYPTKEEQQKIAAVLSAADKEIETLNKELNALKEQKRGLMQKLLTGELRVKF